MTANNTVDAFEFDRTLASGLFKFSNAVSPAEIMHFLDSEGWTADPKFEELFIRECDGHRKFAISFKVRHSGEQKDYRSFMDLCFGKLTRVFHRNFVGYDVTNATCVVKKYETPLTTRLDELGLSSRTLHILKTNGIETLGALVQKTEAEMLRFSQFNLNGLNEVKVLLHLTGRHFGAPSP